MNRFRFSLASLLGFVTVAAIAFLALRNANELWGQVMFTGAVAVLLFAVLAAIYRTGHARAFCVGFLVFGWAYMLMVYGPWLDRHVGQRLVTNAVLYSVNGALQPHDGVDADGSGVWVPGISLDEIVTLQDIQAVGHPLFALLFALVGGVAGRWVHGGGEEVMSTSMKDSLRY